MVIRSKKLKMASLILASSLIAVTTGCEDKKGGEEDPSITEEDPSSGGGGNGGGGGGEPEEEFDVDNIADIEVTVGEDINFVPRSKGGKIKACEVTPNLPDGLVLSNECVFSGKVMTPYPKSTHTLKATNDKGKEKSKDFSLTVISDSDNTNNGGGGSELASCGAIAHGASETRTMYISSTGASCVSETQSRTCNNGTFEAWTGTYTHSSCSEIASDTTPPSNPSINIVGDASILLSQNVTLNLSALDASEMYVTNSAGCSAGGAWEPYATTKTWVMAGNSVYVKYRDNAGNETNCMSDLVSGVYNISTQNLSNGDMYSQDGFFFSRLGNQIVYVDRVSNGMTSVNHVKVANIIDGAIDFSNETSLYIHDPMDFYSEAIQSVLFLKDDLILIGTSSSSIGKFMFVKKNGTSWVSTLTQTYSPNKGNISLRPYAFNGDVISYWEKDGAMNAIRHLYFMGYDQAQWYSLSGTYFNTNSIANNAGENVFAIGNNFMVYQPTGGLMNPSIDTIWFRRYLDDEFLLELQHPAQHNGALSMSSINSATAPVRGTFTPEIRVNTMLYVSAYDNNVANGVKNLSIHRIFNFNPTVFKSFSSNIFDGARALSGSNDLGGQASLLGDQLVAISYHESNGMSTSYGVALYKINEEASGLSLQYISELVTPSTSSRFVVYSGANGSNELLISSVVEGMSVYYVPVKRVALNPLN